MKTEKEELIQGNKLIAEFMGFKYLWHESDEATYILRLPDGEVIEKYLSELEYHNDWNWLMPVVDKIKDVLNDNSNGLWKNGGKEQYDRIQVGLMVAQIKALWIVIVYFIKWYNSIKQIA